MKFVYSSIHGYLNLPVGTLVQISLTGRDREKGRMGLPRKPMLLYIQLLNL